MHLVLLDRAERYDSNEGCTICCIPIEATNKHFPIDVTRTCTRCEGGGLQRYDDAGGCMEYRGEKLQLVCVIDTRQL